MNTPSADLAARFHALHDPRRPLVLANVWDAASARLVAASGAPAVATTSAGVAWSLGRPDGDALSRSDAVAAVARIVDAVAVPVSADIESGYAVRPDDVSQTVSAILDAGAVGINLEDGAATPTEMSARIRAARRAADQAGVRLFVNARTDVYLAGLVAPDDPLAETLSRAARYLEAGADGIFVPGVVDETALIALAAGIDAPVNAMAGPGAPRVSDLGAWGISRVSVGSAVAQAAYAVARRAAVELATSGTYDALADGVDYAELNDLAH